MEMGAQQARNGEDVLPVRHRSEHLGLDPVAVGQHPLLVAARAEVAGLAAERQQVVVPAAKWGYIPNRIVAYGEAEALLAFSEALTYSDLRVGQISVWDG